MNFARVLLLPVLAWLSLSPCAASAADGARPESKIRVLVVTGGHGFEKGQFFQMFKDNPDISYQAVEHPNAHALLKAEAAGAWDVLVLYDMHQAITDEAKSDFIARLKDGKGLVVLHHAMISYQKWPEFTRIVGGHYYLEKTSVNGVEKPQSGYQHDVQFTLHVADPDHPVTRGVKDFQIHDETYLGFDVANDVHPLLTTAEKTSTPTVAWTKSYERARVVYIQLGHDHVAYENPNYRQLLRQAIAWAAQRQ